MSLSERMREGLQEMPSNGAWLLSRARKPVEAVEGAAESARAGARDRRRKVSAALADAAPGGDSVEVRMKRARDAAEQAREAEERAIEAAQESKEASEHASQVSERGRARMAEVERETGQEAEQRVAEAQRAADEAVERERQAAEADAEEEQQETQAEVEQEDEQAQQEAAAAQQRAEELVEEATERLAEARRLADEAAQAARAAAEEAQRQAQQLASEAEEQAGDAEAQLKAAEEIRTYAKTAAKHTARELQRNPTNGSLKSHNKPELVELAAGIGIEGRTNMTKAELVDAITKASRTKR
jgi:colicin import membrane protein